MQVPHSKMKQAMEIGCYVSVIDLNNRKLRMFWPMRGVELFGPSVSDLLDEMKAVQAIIQMDPDYRVITDGGITIRLTDKDGFQMAGMPKLPSTILALIEADEDEWGKAEDQFDAPKEDAVHIKGVHKSGALAYAEGVPASDCPYAEGTVEFSVWNDEWDEAADKEVGQGQADRVGSVVTNRYRATYSEQGHPTHCGDELATLLNNICSNKAGTNLELFEAICNANKVSLAKYNRTTKGWQGRLRMTGRNLLAKRVRENGGVLKMPEGMHPSEYKLGEHWLVEAEHKFKPKTEAA